MYRSHVVDSRVIQGDTAGEKRTAEREGSMARIPSKNLTISSCPSVSSACRCKSQR